MKKPGLFIKWLSPMLFGTCLVVTFGTLISCFSLLDTAIKLAETNGYSLDSLLLRFCFVALLCMMLDFLTLVEFVRFAFNVARFGKVFGRVQTRCLLVISASLLMRALAGLWLPSIEAAMTEGITGPMLDLRLVAFACMFFALAGIFEYGRILQEDSDNIL